MPQKIKVFDEGLPQHNASGEPRSSRPLRERRTNGVERLDPSPTSGKQQRSTTQPHQPQAAGTSGAKSNARQNRDASQSKHSSLDQNEEALLNTPEWEPVTGCAAYPSKIDLSPSTYKEEVHGVRQPPNRTWCEPPKPGTMDPAKLSKTAWRVYEGETDFTSLQLDEMDLLDEKDLELLRKNHESKEGGRVLYQSWASKEMVKFALENPEVMQNLFGCDCVDGQHPNFAKYLGQPCRTLLKPTSGAMYYIKVPGPTSPSIRDCRSFWKWKKPGSDETLGAGQGEPRLHYEKFDCKPKNTPEHHPPEQIPSFVARVYSFHKSTCRCKACHRKFHEGRSDESQDSVHQYVHDIALVQILDGQRGQVKPRKSGKETNSPGHPNASRVPSNSRHLTDSPVNQQVTTPARSNDSGAGSRSASRGRNSRSPCDGAMALNGGGIKKSSSSHSKKEYRFFTQQDLRNKGNNKLADVVRRSDGSSKASRPSAKSATSTPSSRTGGSATRSSSVDATQRSLVFNESCASQLHRDLHSMALTGQSPAQTTRRPPAHPDNANNRAAGPEHNFGPETRPQHNDSSFAQSEMNFEADQDQMPIVSEVETNPQSERAEDEPSYLKLSRFDSQRPDLEGMGDLSAESTSTSDGLFSQHNDNDAGLNQFAFYQTMFIDHDNDRRISTGSHTLQLSPPPHLNPPSLNEHPENQQLFGDDISLHRGEAFGGLAIMENSVWTNSGTDVAMPPCNQEEDMDVIVP